MLNKALHLCSLAALALLLITAQADARLDRPRPGLLKAQTQERQKADQTTSAPAKDERGTPASPLSVEILRGPPKSDAEAAQDAADRQAKASSDWWQLSINIGLVIIGFLQFLGLLGTAAIYLRQANIMNKQVEVSIAVQRAFVYLHSIRPRFVVDDAGQVMSCAFTPIWRNSGASAARKVQYYTTCDFGFGLTPREADFPIREQPKGRTVIGPGAEEFAPTPERITARQFCDFASNNVSICLYGAVDYTDDFGTVHRTEFCVLMPVTGIPTTQDGFNFIKWPCHNGADEDCMREPYAEAGTAPRTGAAAV